MEITDISLFSIKSVQDLREDADFENFNFLSSFEDIFEIFI